MREFFAIKVPALDAWVLNNKELSISDNFDNCEIFSTKEDADNVIATGFKQAGKYQYRLQTSSLVYYYLDNPLPMEVVALMLVPVVV